MAVPRPVVFLDVDGVLHPFHGNLPESQVTTFHMDCMQRLQAIVERTDAEIVLSTSWRNFASTRNKLLANLGQFGMTFNKWIEPDSGIMSSPSAGKLNKILDFVHCHAPVSWVVIDDEDLVALSGLVKTSLMVQLFASRFVQTDSRTGLIDTDLTRIYEILSE